MQDLFKSQGLPPNQADRFNQYLHGGIVPYRLESLDLSVVRNDELFDFAGLFIYFDRLTTGDVSFKLSDPDNDAMPAAANFAIDNIPFRKIYITNTAQAGLVANMWYGFDARIIPPNQDISNINTVTTVANIADITPPDMATSAYYRNSADGALKTIVTPAANLNKVLLSRAQVHVHVAGNSGVRLMMKQSAPVAWNDAAAVTILLEYEAGGGLSMTGRETPFRIPAGYGLYEQASGAGFISNTDVSFKVL